MRFYIYTIFLILIAADCLVAIRSWICHGFFTVIADPNVEHRIHSEGECLMMNSHFDERLRLISAYMVAMNRTLTIYTTTPCIFGNYSRIKTVKFNAKKLLRSYGYNTSAILNINNWIRVPSTDYHHLFARVSDLLRVAIAHKYEYK